MVWAVSSRVLCTQAETVPQFNISLPISPRDTLCNHPTRCPRVVAVTLPLAGAEAEMALQHLGWFVEEAVEVAVAVAAAVLLVAAAAEVASLEPRALP